MRGFCHQAGEPFEKSLPVHELDAIRDELLQVFIVAQAGS